MSNKEVVLVTGCTKGGIGWELCRHFARRGGYTVVATLRDPSKAEFPEEFQKSDKIEVLPLDVTDPKSIASCVETVVKRHGCIDILINNAGRPCVGPLAEVPLEEIRGTFETNVFGLVAMCQAVIPHMARKGRGKIVNIGSVVGWLPIPWGAAYAASKSAVESFTASLRMECAHLGIQAMLVVPGAIKSNFGSNSLASLFMKPEGSSLFDSKREHIVRRANTSQAGDATPTEVFVKSVGDEIARPQMRATLAAGSRSSLMWFFKFFLPTWISEWLMKRKFVL